MSKVTFEVTSEFEEDDEEEIVLAICVCERKKGDLN